MRRCDAHIGNRRGPRNLRHAKLSPDRRLVIFGKTDFPCFLSTPHRLPDPKVARIVYISLRIPRACQTTIKPLQNLIATTFLGCGQLSISAVCNFHLCEISRLAYLPHSRPFHHVARYWAVQYQAPSRSMNPPPPLFFRRKGHLTDH